MPKTRKNCLAISEKNAEVTDGRTDRQTTVILWDPPSDGGPIYIKVPVTSVQVTSDKTIKTNHTMISVND